MNRSILLVNPWIYDFAAYDFWMKPLGLLQLAAILRKNDYRVHLVHCLNRFHPDLRDERQISLPKRRATGHGKYPKEEILKPVALKKIPKRYSRYGITPRILRKELARYPGVNAVFITSMITYWYAGVWELIRIVREMIPRARVVLGGNYVTLCPDHAERAGADICIAGAGEKRLPILLEELFGNRPLFAPTSDDLDVLPYPAFDLLPYYDQLPIMTSRGCPHRCSYCASPLLNQRFRQRDPFRVVDEIAFWHRRLGIRHFSFYDDALLVNPHEMAVPMLKEIARRGLPWEFHCPNGLHVREITEDVSRLLYGAGFRTIRLGFETADPERQTATGGKVSNADLQEAVGHMKRAGYQTNEIGVYLLCGLPGQTAAEVWESISYVRSCGARPIITEYSPIPKTGLWEAALNASPYPLAEEPLFQNNSLLPCQWEELTYEMYQSLKAMATDGGIARE